MKTLMMMLVCLFGLQGLVKASDDKPIEVANLPEKALTFMKQNFPEAKVSYAKMEDDLWNKTYEVVFVNGQKLEFDKNGEWTEVDCKFAVVPATIIPQQIKSYLLKKFPEQKVVKIERDKKQYEVTLDNKLEVTFDKKFNVIELDS